MSAAEWFFLQGSKQVGPFTLEQMGSLLTAGSVRADTLVWRPGRADWTPLSSFEEFSGLSSPLPPAPARSDSGKARMSATAAPVESGPPALEYPGQWVDVAPHPWRRYFARILDNMVWGLAIWFGIGVALAVIDPLLADRLFRILDGPGGRFIDLILTHLVAIVPNAILIGLTGGNLGKWLFGICVLDEANRPIGLARAFRREFMVFVMGLGLAIPIVSLITLIMSYQAIKKNGATNWDRSMGLTVVHRARGPMQYVAFCIGLGLLVAITAMVFAPDQIPWPQ